MDKPLSPDVQDFLDYSLTLMQGDNSEKKQDILTKKAQSLLAKPWSFPKIWSRHPEVLEFAMETLSIEGHRVQVGKDKYSLMLLPYTVHFEGSSGKIHEGHFGSEAMALAAETFCPGSIVAGHALDFEQLREFNPHQLHELLMQIVKDPAKAGEDMDVAHYVEGDVFQFALAIAIPTWDFDELDDYVNQASERGFYKRWTDLMQPMFRDLHGHVDIHMLPAGALDQIDGPVRLSFDLMHAEKALADLCEHLPEDGIVYAALRMTWADDVPDFRIHFNTHLADGTEIGKWEGAVYSGGFDNWSDSLARIFEFFREMDLKNIRIENCSAEDFHNSWMRSGSARFH